jgi:putative oxidoreductase
MTNVKTKSTLVIIARLLLGLIFVVFGFNFFFHFIKAPLPVGLAGTFVGGLFQSGYFFQLLKVVEILSGLLLLIGWFTPLVLIVLFPISLNILLFHAFLEPAGMPLGVIIIVLHLFLAWSYRNYYKPLFTLNASAE